MKSSEVIKTLKTGIVKFGDWEIEVMVNRGRFGVSNIRADDKNKKIVISVEDEDCGEGD